MQVMPNSSVEAPSNGTDGNKISAVAGNATGNEGVVLLLMRHGQTIDNVNRIMQGQTQGMLTDEGRQQAAATAQQWAAQPIDVFVASDLRRAIDTCRIMVLPHFNGDAQRAERAIVTTPLLRERDWGSFTGRYIPDLKDAVWTDDIETVEAMLQRAEQFIRWIKHRYAGKTVLAVGHGIINKAIQSVHYNMPMNQIKPMGNAEIRTLHL